MNTSKDVVVWLVMAAAAEVNKELAGVTMVVANESETQRLLTLC